MARRTWHQGDRLSELAAAGAERGCVVGGRVRGVSDPVLMQIGLILGFLTGYPAVAWLVGRGTKATV